MAYETIVYVEDSAIETITLNRPDDGNMFDIQMHTRSPCTRPCTRMSAANASANALSVFQSMFRLLSRNASSSGRACACPAISV